MGSCVVALMTLLTLTPDTKLADLVGVTSRYNNHALVVAVVAAESAFNPKAVSSAGAQGLMQIMPTTRDWLRDTFKEKCSLGKGSDLLDPATNIAYGSCYLKHLDELYEGDLVKMLVHYNSGGAGVKRLYKHRRIYKETSEYVPRVLKHYFYCLNRRAK